MHIIMLFPYYSSLLHLKKKVMKSFNDWEEQTKNEWRDCEILHQEGIKTNEK